MQKPEEKCAGCGKKIVVGDYLVERINGVKTQNGVFHSDVGMMFCDDACEEKFILSKNKNRFNAPKHVP